jgi:uncharacterized phiE125 gp8 family phage protein
MYLETTVKPTQQPVTLFQVHDHLRETSNEEDLLMTGLIQAATSHVESFLRRRLIMQTVIAHGDDFCSLDQLPVAPVSAVIGITYRALDDTVLTVDPSIYRATLNREPPLIMPKWGYVWPISQPGPDTVQVTMTVGYGTADDVPATIKAAILMMIGHLYTNREAVSDVPMGTVPLGVTAMLQPFVFWV